MEGGHDNLSVLAEHIQQAGEPGVQAAASFVLVSEQLQQIVPQLEHTSQIHEVGAQTMQRISEGLQSENNRNEQMLEQVQNCSHTWSLTQQQMADRVAKGVDGALADKLIEARSHFVADVKAASEALKQSGVGVANQFEESSASLVNQLTASGASWAETNNGNLLYRVNSGPRPFQVLLIPWKQTSEQWAAQVQLTGQKWSETVDSAAKEAGRELETSGECRGGDANAVCG